MERQDQLAAVAALGDPVRRALFEAVRQSPVPLGVDSLTRTLGIPRSTVVFQLQKLVDAGVLSIEFAKPGRRRGPGSGRPAKLYLPRQGEVAASVPDRHYDLAAQLMAAAIERSTASGSAVQQALAEVAFDVGSRLGADAGSIGEALRLNGFAPRTDGKGGYLLHNCPFHRLARSHTDVVCGMNGALLTGALQGCADKDHDVVPDPDGPYCCARIVRRQVE
ncbi:helix-turn-helix domain-containing protein [Paenarthrobacter sp. Z7-10]|nr:helix-turn-helix domain-containing protein [Paenarthrobacter sp. Z7-10]